MSAGVKCICDAEGGFSLRRNGQIFDAVSAQKKRHQRDATERDGNGV